MTTLTLIRIDTIAETCPMCGKVAKKIAVIEDADGTRIYAAGKCARLLLGYDPFKKENFQ